MKFGVYIRTGTTYSGMWELAKQAEKLDYFGQQSFKVNKLFISPPATRV